MNFVKKLFVSSSLLTCFYFINWWWSVDSKSGDLPYIVSFEIFTETDLQIESLHYGGVSPVFELIPTPALFFDISEFWLNKYSSPLVFETQIAYVFDESYGIFHPVIKIISSNLKWSSILWISIKMSTKKLISFIFQQVSALVRERMDMLCFEIILKPNLDLTSSPLFFAKIT